MKRFLFSMAIVALSFCAPPHAKAATDISIDFFYDNLGDDGNWIEVGDYGYCWQPNVAVSDRSWRPYADGYWAYTDVGWTWVSYENFGWATYHYGRWARLRDTGWIWVPSTEWGPAWVSWRTGGDHVGWAPLPPRYERGEPIYEGRPITNRVDIEFDIGPECYNFVDVRYIGEPVLRRRIVDSRENVTYIENTVNVTNITYSNSVVYNYGPDYNRLSAYSTRQIPRLQLQREENVDLRAAARSNAVTKVQGDQLVIAAPMRVERSAPSIAPKVVKTKIEKANLETGWSGIDQKRRADLQAKFKTEDMKNIPPTKVKAVRPDELKNATTASPAAIESATPARNVRDIKKQKDNLSMPTPTISPNENKVKGRDQRGLRGSSLPSASMTPMAGETATPAMTPNESKMKGNKRGVTGRPSPLATIAPSAEGTATPAMTPNEKKIKAGRNVERFQRTPNATATPGDAYETPKAPKNLQLERRPNMQDASDNSGPRAPKELKALQSEGINSNAGASQNVQQANERKFKQQQQQNRVNQTIAPNNASDGAPPQTQGEVKGKGERGKKPKQNEQTPSPTPNQ